jgi:acetylornithine deacetylase
MLQVPGRSAHASSRHLGESALEHFIPIHQALLRNEFEINETENDPLMKKFPLPYSINIGTINGGRWSSSVMDSLSLQVRVGVSLSETVEQAEERFRGVVAEAASQVPWLVENPPLVTKLAAGFGSARTPSDHPLIHTIQSASALEFGEPAPLTGAPFGCDMSGWVRHAGVPTVVYGPGDLKYAHSPNEQVSLTRTEQVARVLVRATEELLECDPQKLAAARPPVEKIKIP